VKVKGSHDNLTEDMMVEVVKRQHSVRKAFRFYVFLQKEASMSSFFQEFHLK
jgi:hypothetical protein